MHILEHSHSHPWVSLSCLGMTCETCLRYNCVGSNCPPSNSQLHTPFAFPPSLPHSYSAFEDGGSITKKEMMKRLHRPSFLIKLL